MSKPDNSEKKRMPRNIRKKYVNGKKYERKKKRQDIKKVLKCEVRFLAEIEFDSHECSYYNNHISILIK